MVRRLHSRLATRAAAVALATSLAACSETPTTPRISPRALTASLEVSGAPRTAQRHPNAVKYRDAGYKPATGRAGSASLMVRALLGKDRQTALEVTTGVLDDAATPPGNVDKIQLKIFNLVGGLMSTSNYNNLRGGGYASHSLANLTRGSGVQVQANVSGIDANRADVVTVSGTVRMRPDIAVTAISAPENALVGVPFTVVADVGELNGDVGARANCVVSVDGTPVGTATGIWVDAAGAVSCLFTVSVSTPGVAKIAVTATGIKPGDYDSANNVKETSIRVDQRATAFFFGVTAADYKQIAGWKVSTDYTYGPDPAGVTFRFRSIQQTSRFEMEQRFGAIAASIDRELPFPILGLSVLHETDGATLLTRTWDLPALPERSIDNESLRQSCGASYETFDDGRGSLFTDVCSGVQRFDGSEYPFTFIGQVRLLTQVTYWAAQGEIEQHDARLTPPDQFYTFNTDIDEPSILPPLGRTYRIRLELPSGDWLYVNDATVELAPYQFDYPVEPWTCRPMDIPYYVGENCEEHYGGGEFGRLGFVNGYGTVEPRVTALTP
jgi:hypothetical protein